MILLSDKKVKLKIPINNNNYNNCNNYNNYNKNINNSYEKKNLILIEDYEIVNKYNNNNIINKEKEKKEIKGLKEIKELKEINSLKELKRINSYSYFTKEKEKEKKFPIIKDSKIINEKIFDININNINEINKELNKIKIDKFNDNDNDKAKDYYKENDKDKYNIYMDKIKEEHIKVDQDVIKKENYYSKLRELGENLYQKNSKKNNNNKIKVKDKDKDKDVDYNNEGDLRSTCRLMPIGLIRSPNSGEFCKYNLFDEYNINNNIKEFLIIKNEKDENKNFPKRKFSPRTFENKKNNPFLKHKIINEFISRIKY
jgi:hypothetical protein